MDREAEELGGIQDAAGEDPAGEDTGAASEEAEEELQVRKRYFLSVLTFK